MDVATVIPAYRPVQSWLREALQSVERQTHRPSEVVVVDDGSPETVRLPATDLPVRLIRQPNAGISGARNRGISEVTAPVVHILDQDDVIEPTFYERLVPAFADELVGVAFSTCQWASPDMEPVNILTPWPGWTPGTDWLYDLLRGENPVASVSACFRRAAWERAGGYRPLKMVNDYRFWIDVARHGWSFVHVPEVLAWHRRHEGQSTADWHAPVGESMRMLASLHLPPRYQYRRWRSVLRMRRALRATVSG